MEHIRIIIVAKIINIILHCISLHMMYTVMTRAYVPLLLNANFGGPALCAAGYPQKRGPLPPPMCGRGRLPN